MYGVFYTVVMEEKDLELFIEATTAIFNEIGFEVSVTEPDINSVFAADVVANIGITGEIKGFLILKSNLAGAHAFITKMLSNLNMETEEDDFGQFHKEALGEVLNQISGRSTMLLEGRNIHCDITPPTLIIGSRIQSNPADSEYTLNRYLSGDFGIFNFYVGVKNNS